MSENKSSSTFSETPSLKGVIHQRDNSSGLYSNVNYIYRADGMGIDWRKMLLPEHLAFNNSYAAAIKSAYNVTNLNELDKTKVEDKYLVILLSGIKYLARIRGYSCVHNTIVYSSHDKATANCCITWLPNIETNGVSVSFSDSASASLVNTNGFGNYFLESIACNRAFVRAVRNFLDINIVGADELKTNDVNQSASQTSQEVDTGDLPKDLLKAELKKKGINTLKALKSHDKVIQNKTEFTVPPEEWSKIEEMDVSDIYKLLSFFKD